jgi:hypothetical protein
MDSVSFGFDWKTMVIVELEIQKCVHSVQFIQLSYEQEDFH